MQGSFTASFQYQFTHPRTAFFHQQYQITHPHQRQRGRQQQEAKIDQRSGERIAGSILCCIRVDP